MWSVLCEIYSDFQLSDKKKGISNVLSVLFLVYSPLIQSTRPLLLHIKSFCLVSQREAFTVTQPSSGPTLTQVSVLRSPRFFRLHQSRKQFSEIIREEESLKAGSVESECLTFDLSYISVQLLSNHLELLPLLLHSTLSLLQLLVQLQEPTALLEPELHLGVGRTGRVFSSLLQDAEHRIIRSCFADVLQDLVHGGRLRPAGQHHPLLAFRAEVHSAGGRASAGQDTDYPSD